MPWNGQTAHQYAWPSRPRGWKSARWWNVVVPPSVEPTCSSSQARPGTRISARSRRNVLSSVASTRQKSSASPTTRSFWLRRSMRPRIHQASGQEYQPLRPPMPSMIVQSDSGDASTSRVRSSLYSDPPAQSGSDGRGSDGAPAVAADDHRVGTSSVWILVSASSQARWKPISPSGGSGTYCLMSSSAATTVFFNESTSGRAMLAGTGVTMPTQWLDRPGVSTGTGTTRRRVRPATCA